jgi:excisionase family DNA binding protein
MREPAGIRTDAMGTSTSAALDPAPIARPARLLPTLEPLLTLGEVAALLRVSGKTVQRLVAARRLPCVRIGRRVRFTSADVFRFVAARKD